MMRKVIVYVLLLLLVSVPKDGLTAFDAFEKNSSLPGIVVGEVECYGPKSLKREFMLTLEEMLQAKLMETHRFRVEQKSFSIVPASDSIGKNSAALSGDLSKMHMAVIIKSGTYDKGKSHVALIKHAMQYGDKKAVAIGENVVQIKGTVLEHAKQVGAACNAKYLLFCNIKDVDVILNQNNYFLDISGTRVKINLDYYLVNTANGKVFFKNSSMNKETNMVSFQGLSFGKTHSVQDLLHKLLEKQSKEITDEIIDNGIERIEK